MGENIALGAFGGTALLFAGLLIWSLKKSKALFFNLFCIGLVLSSALTVGEIYYRFIYDTSDSFGITKVAQRWFNRYYQSNSVGSRDDRDYPLTIPDKKRRFTFMGDSFTAGHGIQNIEDRFTNQIRAAKPNWDVNIFAYNGYSTQSEILLIKKLAEKGFELDTVVLVYCLNDLDDLAPDSRSVQTAIYKDPLFKNGFVKNSYFINTWYARIKAMQIPAIGNYFEHNIKAYEGRYFEIQKRRLETLKNLVEKAGGKLRVITFPFLHQMGKDYLFEETHKKLGAFWKKQEVPHLDLYPLYRKYQAKELVVNQYDAHPNEFAHKLASSKILEFLELHLGE